jgi:hypothetical protein
LFTGDAQATTMTNDGAACCATDVSCGRRGIKFPCPHCTPSPSHLASEGWGASKPFGMPGASVLIFVLTLVLIFVLIFEGQGGSHSNHRRVCSSVRHAVRRLDNYITTHFFWCFSAACSCPKPFLFQQRMVSGTTSLHVI